LLLKKRYEIEILKTRYEDLIAITSDAQKEGLQKLKSEAISQSERDLEDIMGDDPASRKVQATRAQIETLERDLKKVKDRASGLIMALNGLLEKLP
jgi:polyhydroxyalkanoate synthesis regulator phasin